VIAKWNEQYAKPTGNSIQLDDKSNSLSPTAIIGVAAAVAIMIAAWIAGLFIARGGDRDRIDEHITKNDNKNGHNIKDAELGLGSYNLDVDPPQLATEPESLSQDKSDRSSDWSSSFELSSLCTSTFDSLTDDDMPLASSTIVNLGSLSVLKA
jgi:hypothetical protein